MDLQLTNSTVVVVGGGSGIGKACSAAFEAEGARVAIWDCDISSSPDSAELSLPVDIVDQAAVQNALAATEKQLGPIDHLVNAAAVGSGKVGRPFTNLQTSDWDSVLDVNVKGMVNIAHVVAPTMVVRKTGSFVFIASVAGQIGSPTDPPYSASKAANINFAQVMARDLASHGVRVNTVCPGMVQTPLNRSVWKAGNEKLPATEQQTYEEWAAEKIQQLVPLNRWQSAEDIANMVVFLTSSRALQVTGQTINVDGGYVMHS